MASASFETRMPRNFGVRPSVIFDKYLRAHAHRVAARPYIAIEMREFVHSVDGARRRAAKRVYLWRAEMKVGNEPRAIRTFHRFDLNPLALISDAPRFGDRTFGKGEFPAFGADLLVTQSVHFRKPLNATAVGVKRFERINAWDASAPASAKNPWQGNLADIRALMFRKPLRRRGAGLPMNIRRRRKLAL